MTIANAVTAKVGAGGAVCIYNEASTHLIVDVNGYFPPAAGYGALDPARLLDTRRSSPSAAAEDSALILINQLRASRGLVPVQPDATMTAFARGWSSTMSQSGFRHSGGPYSENVGWIRASVLVAGGRSTRVVQRLPGESAAPRQHGQSGVDVRSESACTRTGPPGTSRSNSAEPQLSAAASALGVVVFGPGGSFDPCRTIRSRLL